MLITAFRTGKPLEANRQRIIFAGAAASESCWTAAGMLLQVQRTWRGQLTQPFHDDTTHIQQFTHEPACGILSLFCTEAMAVRAQQ